MMICDPKIDPSKLSVDDKIQLIHESDGLLVDVLEGLEVEGHLYLYGCTSLTHLPEGLEVGRSLCLDGCTSLTHLPEGLKIERTLDLEGCTSFTHLPEGLKVGGDLDLCGCTSLTHLPEGLEVEHLNLGGCTSLPYKEYKEKDLPKSIKVKGKVLWLSIHRK